MVDPGPPPRKAIILTVKLLRRRRAISLGSRATTRWLPPLALGKIRDRKKWSLKWSMNARDNHQAYSYIIKNEIGLAGLVS